MVTNPLLALLGIQMFITGIPIIGSMTIIHIPCFGPSAYKGLTDEIKATSSLCCGRPFLQWSFAPKSGAVQAPCLGGAIVVERGMNNHVKIVTFGKWGYQVISYPNNRLL